MRDALIGFHFPVMMKTTQKKRAKKRNNNFFSVCVEKRNDFRVVVKFSVVGKFGGNDLKNMVGNG